MRRFLRPTSYVLLSTFCVLLSTVLIHAASLDEQAQAAWSHRDQPGQTEKAVTLWEKSGEDNPNVLIHLTKGYGRLYRHTNIAEERTHWADLARKTGEEAAAKAPANSDAFAAYAEALGQWAQAHKGVHSLPTVSLAVDNLKKAVALKPENAYAHMLLASFYLHSPRIVSVGDKTKALEQAQLAVQYGPDHAINHLVLARVYLDAGKKEAGIAELQTILALPAPADSVPETKADQKTAKSLLVSLGVSPAVTPTPAPASSTCADSNGSCTEKQP